MPILQCFTIQKLEPNQSDLKMVCVFWLPTFLFSPSTETACRNVTCSQLKSGDFCVFNHHQLFIFALSAVFFPKINEFKKATAQLFKKFCFRLCASTTREIRIGSGITIQEIPFWQPRHNQPAISSSRPAISALISLTPAVKLWDDLLFSNVRLTKLLLSA